MRFEKKRFGARVVNKKKKETVKFCEIEQNGKTRLIPESRPRTWTGSRERRQNESISISDEVQHMWRKCDLHRKL